MRRDVKNRIEQDLGAYIENDDLQEFSILHMYPKGLAYPDGYINAKHFNLVVFNPKTKEKRTSYNNHHDIIRYENCEIVLSMVYADGSFLIRFSHPVRFTNGMDTQAVFITKA